MIFPVLDIWPDGTTLLYNRGCGILLLPIGVAPSILRTKA
jgi:hypothetical protein